MAAPSVADAKRNDKLNSLFGTLGDANLSSENNAGHHAAWDALWDDKSFLPWDRGAPQPALHDALKEHVRELGDARHEPDGTVVADGARRKALVPGCGRGYDVFQLRAFGWDVTGVEISANAVAEAKRVEELIAQGKGPGEGLYEGVGYGAVSSEVGLGVARIVSQDLFALEGEGTWDLIFDYTFFCALPPTIRHKYADKLARLLSPNGRLICIEFPTAKPTTSGGPPWAMIEDVYLAYLQHPGQTFEYDAEGKVQYDRSQPRSANGLERLARWRPQRTHPAGKESDWVSIWGHASSSS